MCLLVKWVMPYLIGTLPTIITMALEVVVHLLFFRMARQLLLLAAAAHHMMRLPIGHLTCVMHHLPQAQASQDLTPRW
jgi:hypothetical protein